MSEAQQERTVTEAGGPTARLAADVHKRLLTIQYERRMAGAYVSLSDIIRELLDRAGAA